LCSPRSGARGESVSSLSREIAAQSGWKRRDVYRLANEINKGATEAV
jgi:hypothetical protein